MQGNHQKDAKVSKKEKKERDGERNGTSSRARSLKVARKAFGKGLIQKTRYSGKERSVRNGGLS